MTSDIENKLAQLSENIRKSRSALVCFSGGVDSAFVLAMATRTLGHRAIGMTALSPSLPESDLEQAKAFAREIGAEHRLVVSTEMDDPSYLRNDTDRCFHCRTALYRIARQKCEEWGLDDILNGTNCDDSGDYRPGLEAAKNASVKSPLVDCGFTKADVRAGSKVIGLSLWDKPAAACLSSRIPYGTPVTRSLLEQIGGFEADLKGFGFRQVRVRYHEKLARVELDVAEISRAVDPSIRDQIVAAGKRHGFQYVTLDLGGYRTCSHNEVLIGNHLKLV
jgi:pyridinium-3,5-biscarboxylic acid mononucleotide sulfurtransferase